jgi:hypothetical protein
VRVAFGLVLLFVAATVNAQSADIEARYEQAITLRTQGSDDAALLVLQSIDAQAPSGRSKAQIALAKQALGQWVEAERDLLRALAQPDEWVESRKSSLDVSLVAIRAKLGSLNIVGVPQQAHAALFIDGSVVNAYPAQTTVRVPAGKHTVEVRAPGYVAIERSVTIPANGLAREPFPIAQHPASAAGDTSAPVGIPSNPERAVTASDQSTVRIVGWAALGLGVAAGAVAVGSALTSEAHVARYNDDPRCSNPVKPSACTDDRTLANTWQTVAIASGIGAVLLLGTGLVLLLSAHASPTRVTLGPSGVAWRF